jgi:hypothetical protein
MIGTDFIGTTVAVDPTSSVSVKSKDELISLLPNNYEFVVFSEKNDAWTGEYFLQPLTDILQFNRAEQYDVVAYPREKKNSIPLHGPRP